MVSPCEIIFLYVYFFFPAEMEAIWDSKSLSEESGLRECKSILSTPAHHCLLFCGERSSHLQAGCPAETALEAGSRPSTTCLCFWGWQRDVLRTGTIWPLTPKGTCELFTTSPNSQWKLGIYLLHVSLFLARTRVLSLFVPWTPLKVWKPVFLFYLFIIFFKPVFLNA